ncbi:hypothetical protein ACWCWD_06280 [Streptomyces sp. NPDC001493]
MATRLTFLIDARDGASRVLDRIGDNATRLGRRMLTASINGEAAMNRLGRSTTDRMAAMERSTGLGEKAASRLKGALIALGPAAIPAAASLAPLAAGAGAAAVAAGAYAAALGPQISAMTEAAEAEKKYTDAVEASGERSEAAVTAQLDYLRTLATMPPETRRAAAAQSVLTDEYNAWSDSLSGDTMGPVIKGMGILTALLPKTSGLVKGTSGELDRMVTILAGGMESPGLDGLNSKFTAFATGALDRVNDGLVRLMRTGSSGRVGTGLTEFMDYAREQGPVVADTVHNVADALVNVLRASSDVGVGMLDVVNALTGIVAAVPPEAIAAVLQLALAIKAVQLAAVGMGAARTAMASFGTQLVAMRVAAAAAPGRLAAVGAAIGALSKAAKLAVAGTAIGLLVLAVTQLSQMGKQAPPDVDRLTTSLGKLAQTGKVSGEAARAFGSDLGGLADSLRDLSRPANYDKFESFMAGLIGMDSATMRDAKADLDSVDKALSNLVQGGKTQLAQAAFDQLAAAMRKNGMSAGELRGKLDDYQAALADQAFEAQLAAQAQGLFGAQAQQVQAKLDTQKASADGLRQSIQALNDVNRAGLGGMIGFEAAIDAAAKAAKDNAGALSMSGGQLNLNSEKARTAATALSDLAARTDEATAAARQSGADWSEVNAIYDRGRSKLLASAQAMGLTKAQAAELADQILATPDKTARIKGNLEDLEAKLSSAKARLQSVPDSRRAAIRAEISDLQAKVAQARAALGTVQSKTVSVMVQYRSSKNPSSFATSIGGYASGGKPKPGELAWVGEEGPELMRFGSGGAEVYSHRDSMAMVSSAASAGRDAGLGLRRGMAVSTDGVESSGRSLGAAILYGVRDELQIASPSKKTKALAADAGKGLIVGMTGSKAQIKATAADLAKDIWAAWSGTKSTKDSRLVAMVNRDTAKLQGLASKRDSLAAQITAARAYSAELKTSARDDAKLSNLGLSDEEVTAGSIQAGLQQKLAKMRQFTSYVTTLAKKGLSKGLLRQVLDMGPDQGYAYASALAGASSTALKAINATQLGIDRASTTLGNTGADLLYDSGANAGKGYLKGLQSQQAAIEKQMLTIAKGMDKAIRKALGIKSPSTVAAKSGGYFTQGLGVGALAQVPFLDRAMATVTGRMAAARPVVGRPAVTGGRASGDQQVINLGVTFSGVIDRIGAAKEIQRLLAELALTTGQPIRLGVTG